MSKDLKHQYMEVRCNYIDDDPDDLFWRVDAWKTDDDNEEGCVVAYVDDITGRVVYADPDAWFDESVQEIIEGKVSEIKERLSKEDGELWNRLKAHFGHHVEIAVCGDADDPTGVCLKDIDTNEVILDAEIYALVARKIIDEEG